MAPATILLTLGSLFLLGLCADLVGRHTPLPRVTLLILGGLAVGPAGLAWIPPEMVQDWFPVLTNIALGMVGFLLGEQIHIGALRSQGTAVALLALGKVLGVMLTVTVAMLLCGVELPLALLLGGIATATDPAATVDVVRESGAKGPFPQTLMRVAAVDDGYGLLAFSLLTAVAGVLLGRGGVEASALEGLREVFGSLVLGILLGVPMGLLSGRVQKGEPTQAEALGFVLACVGMALWAELSPILATMAMGSSVASVRRRHMRPFHAVEGMEWPFLILFFVLAGAALQPDRLAQVGLLGGAYLVARSLGSWLGILACPGTLMPGPGVRRYLGLALLPQAGVAIGMALLASQRFPGFADTLLTVALASTVVFEVGGPIFTRWCLRKVQGLQGVPGTGPGMG